MQFIGKRISILEKDGLLSLVILPTDNKKKLGLLFLWLFAWTVSGVIIFASYFKLRDDNARLFIIIWMAFWLYFEVRISRAYVWKRFGKEKIWIKDGILHHKKEVSGRGKIQTYEVALITDLGLVDISTASFADNFNQSFWVKGGERIEFRCQTRMVRFGMQLSEEEARELVGRLKHYLKQLGKA